jgi:acetyltransferase EpsM
VGAHVGAGATLRQGILVGDWATVGAGAVVVADVVAEVTVVGVPAKPMPTRPPGNR